MRVLREGQSQHCCWLHKGGLNHVNAHLIVVLLYAVVPLKMRGTLVWPSSHVSIKNSPDEVLHATLKVKEKDLTPAAKLMTLVLMDINQSKACKRKSLRKRCSFTC